jgi:4-amino-4-deoxy-L-arabinose transferase-like glycosyltransferase
MQLPKRTSWSNSILWIIVAGMVLRVLLAIWAYPATDMIQRMTVTRNLVADGVRGFLAPRFDIDGPNPVYVILECPLYNLLVACLVWISGIDVDVAGKLVSLGLSLGLLLACAKLFEIWLPEERMRFWAMLAISFSPTVAYLGQSQCIDLLTTLLAVLCFLVTDKLTRLENRGTGIHWYLLALLLYGCLLLSKVNVGVGVLSVCGVFSIYRLRLSPRRLVAVSCAMAGAIGIYILWQIHAEATKSPDARYALTWSSIFKVSRLKWFAKNAMYLRNPIVLMTPLGLALTAYGCLILVRERKGFPYLFIWLLMTGINFLVFIVYFGHVHYWIILAPGCAAMLGLGLERFLQSATWGRFGPGSRRLGAGIAVVATLVSMAGLLTYLMLPRFQHWVRGLQDLKSRSRPDDLVLFAGRYVDVLGIGVPYHSERRGWIVSDFDKDRPAFIRKKIAAGARWLIVLDATPAEAAAYLEIDKDTKWVLRSQAMVRARMSTQGIGLKDRSYSIFEWHE